MALDPTETRVFEIYKVGDLIKSPKGHLSIECETDAGTVAFWCARMTSSLRTMQRRTPPFKVRCGCREPLPNFPTHAWWVPDGAAIEFVESREVLEPPSDMMEPAPPAPPPPPPAPPSPPAPAPIPLSAPVSAPVATPVTPAAAVSTSVPAASPFRALAREGRTLYVIGATKSTAWDDEPTAQPGVFVPALYAYRGRAVRDWLGSTDRAQAAHWLFLSARYGLIEPEHPIANSDASFADAGSGPISDDALRLQVKHQRRWNDQVALSEFQTVYVWGESPVYEEKVRAAFELVGAKVVKLETVSRAT